MSPGLTSHPLARAWWCASARCHPVKRRSAPRRSAATAPHHKSYVVGLVVAESLAVSGGVTATPLRELATVRAWPRSFGDSRHSPAGKQLAGVQNSCPKSTSHNHRMRGVSSTFGPPGNHPSGQDPISRQWHRGHLSKWPGRPDRPRVAEIRCRVAHPGPATPTNSGRHATTILGLVGRRDLSPAGELG